MTSTFSTKIPTNQLPTISDYLIWNFCEAHKGTAGFDKSDAVQTYLTKT